MAEKKTIATKFDFKKEYKYLFSPSVREPEILQVPSFKYIMIDGVGYPGDSTDFQGKIQVIYGLAYTIKFMLKAHGTETFEFKVPPFSGLYYADDMTVFSDDSKKHEWKWTLMILLPDRVTSSVFEKAKQNLIKKKNPPAALKAYLQIYEEGLCAQIMHVGPYSQEGPTVKKLHDFFQEKGYTFNGHHHEIYLGNPMRSKPEKLKTIIRQPIKKL